MARQERIDVEAEFAKAGLPRTPPQRGSRPPPSKGSTVTARLLIGLTLTVVVLGVLLAIAGLDGCMQPNRLKRMQCHAENRSLSEVLGLPSALYTALAIAWVCLLVLLVLGVLFNATNRRKTTRVGR